MYQDYCYWHEDVFLVPYRGVLFFENDLPKPVDEMTFHVSIAPWIYLLGKDVQVRSYLVPHRYYFEGKYHQGKKRRYFVRLCYWETHVAAFETYTGVPVTGNVKFFDIEKTKRLAEDITNFRVVIAEVSPSREGLDT